MFGFGRVPVPQEVSMNSRKVIFDKRASAIMVDRERTPQKSELLLQARYSLLSIGTELVDFLALRRGAAFPAHPGYSLVGEVLQAGSAVQGYAPGDLVWCLGNHETHPVVPAEEGWCLKLSRDDDPLTAVFLALGKVALHGVRRLAIEPNEPVAVFGLGLVGQLSAALARLCGASPVIGVDILDDRCALAARCGATVTINPLKTDPVQAILAATRGRGASAIIEASGSPKVFPWLFKAAAYAGRIAIVGGVHQDVPTDFYTDFQKKELTVIGCRQVDFYAPTPYDRWTFTTNLQSILDLMRDRRLDMRPYITRTVAFDDVLNVYHDLAAGKNQDYLGVVIDYGRA
jgi:2-desacetyl-2-hydroxyethyl bacteriochlorophyllide A dehydrogenase